MKIEKESLGGTSRSSLSTQETKRLHDLILGY